MYESKLSDFGKRNKDDAGAAATRGKLGGVLMQHRHFAVIAGLIADLDDKGIRIHVAEHFRRGLARTNERFDGARFIKACKLEPES